MRITFFLLLTVGIISCSGPQGERAATGEAGTSALIAGEYDSFIADTGESKIEWVGARPASQHNGTIGLQEGELKVVDGEILAGLFIIDMNTIEVLDITDPSRNARLRGHLMNEDFFDVPLYPVAKFEIIAVIELTDTENRFSHLVSGNLTMKDITRLVSFNANINIEDETITAQSEIFLIDRTEWGVNYQSKSVFGDLIDNFILDDIALEIKLETVKSN